MEFAKIMFWLMVVALIIITYVVAQMTDGDNMYLGATVFLGIAIITMITITMITVHIRNENTGNIETQKRIEEVQSLLQEDEVKSNKEIASQLQEELQSLQERQDVSSATR